MNEYEEKVKMLDERMNEYYSTRREFNGIENKGCIWYVTFPVLFAFDFFMPLIYFLVKSIVKSKML